MKDLPHEGADSFFRSFTFFHRIFNSSGVATQYVYQSPSLWYGQDCTVIIGSNCSHVQVILFGSIMRRVKTHLMNTRNSVIPSGTIIQSW